MSILRDPGEQPLDDMIHQLGLVRFEQLPILIQLGFLPLLIDVLQRAEQAFFDFLVRRGLQKIIEATQFDALLCIPEFRVRGQQDTKCVRIPFLYLSIQFETIFIRHLDIRQQDIHRDFAENGEGLFTACRGSDDVDACRGSDDVDTEILEVHPRQYALDYGHLIVNDEDVHDPFLLFILSGSGGRSVNTHRLQGH